MQNTRHFWDRLISFDIYSFCRTNTAIATSAHTNTPRKKHVFLQFLLETPMNPTEPDEVISCSCLSDQLNTPRAAGSICIGVGVERCLQRFTTRSRPLSTATVDICTVYIYIYPKLSNVIGALPSANLASPATTCSTKSNLPCWKAAFFNFDKSCSLLQLQSC